MPSNQRPQSEDEFVEQAFEHLGLDPDEVPDDHELWDYLMPTPNGIRNPSNSYQCWFNCEVTPQEFAESFARGEGFVYTDEDDPEGFTREVWAGTGIMHNPIRPRS